MHFLGVNEKMVKVNSLLIEINDAIIAANEGIVRFNAKEIAKNTEILNGKIKPSSTTPAKNAARVKKTHHEDQKLRRKQTQILKKWTP